MAALLVLAITAIAPVARAADTFTGSILLPGGVEPMARLMYLANEELNGLVGYVVDLGKRWDNGTPWTLTETGGIGPVDEYVTFYASIDGARGEACPYLIDSDNGTARSGRIACNDLNGNGQVSGSERARWAIVIMVPGIAGSFSLSVG